MERRTGTGDQGGFTYLALLWWVAITGAALGALGDYWSTTLLREKEAELIFIGEQYQQALERYGATGRFPKRLEQLLGDESSKLPRRYLRKIFIDPMTGNERWGTVTLSDGQIIGVYSLSDKQPMKVAGFSERNSNFKNKKRYSEWQFIASNAPQSNAAKLPAFPDNRKFGGPTPGGLSAAPPATWTPGLSRE
jgi:type II secretory pathway pseudopilin PulG